MARRAQVWVEQMLLFGGGLTLWQIYVVRAQVPEFMLPPPGKVWHRLQEAFVTGSLLQHTGVTLSEIMVGFVIGTVCGLAIGIVLAWMPILHQALSPYILLAQAAPKIALAPLFVIWFGLGFTSKLALIISMVFFPVMVGVQLGVSSVPREVRYLGRLLRLNPLQRLLHIDLPACLPDLMAGMKVGIVQAVIAAIVAEWMSGKAGLGYTLVFASSTYDTPLLLVGIVATTMLGLLLYKTVEVAEARLLVWHESRQIR